MNLNLLHQKLIAAARSERPSERVPYAFEKRIMAHLISRPALVDHWAQWSQALWRAAVPCVAIMLLLSAWSFFLSNNAPATDLSQDIENTVLAAVNQEQTLDGVW